MAFVPNSIITLTTDFGLDDPFAGIMKGVILSVNPEAKIVDITHGVPAQDILAGSLMLQSSCAYFPKGTIHVAVVDPGVGSGRRPLLALGGDYAFVGPDNGLLARVIESQQHVRVFHLTEQAYCLKPVSRTFHGRDIFAPVAAWLARGISPELFGPLVDDWIRLDWPSPRPIGPGRLQGTVLHIDRFGNLMTNISQEHLSEARAGFEIVLGNSKINRLCWSYAEAADGEPFAILGSAGLLEISVKRASAAEQLGVRRLQEFEVRFF
ncbi:MAG: SAM-dependent chlorinase/fluorinase [Acidobacteria bacterium]|nr:SAM-dependent chlorinase/fluorinase [Acidobacteriota bacterium]MCI0626607.1 SAM-dependent chlorinase/fluorinase [Acidobacteriota bacterium]MCI0719418.1 SAM-dependent chlorinase/fluorinase [Acidobacteriota bacterium]